jgi:hypothetical protein
LDAPITDPILVASESRVLCDLRKGVSKSALSRAKELEQTTTNSPNDSGFRSTAEHLKETRLAGSWVKAFGAFEGSKKTTKKQKLVHLEGLKVLGNCLEAVLDWWAVNFQSWPLDQMRSAQVVFRSLFILEASQNSIYLFVEETGTSSSDVSALVQVEHQ